MRLFIAPPRFHFPEAPPSGGNFGLKTEFEKIKSQQQVELVFNNLALPLAL